MPSWPLSRAAPGALLLRVAAERLLEQVMKRKRRQTRGPAKRGQRWPGAQAPLRVSAQHGGVWDSPCAFQQAVCILGPCSRRGEGGRGWRGAPRRVRSPRRAEALGGRCSPAGAAEADEAPEQRRLVQPLLLLGGLLPGTRRCRRWCFHHGPGTPAAHRSWCVTHCRRFSI